MVFTYSTTSSTSSPSSSYSSYSTCAMEIPSSRPRSLSPSCAYPSWPQGSSMGRSAGQSTSFIISDEELFPSVFEEDSRDCTPPTTPNASRSPASPACLYEPRIVADTGSMMRGLLAQEKAKREQQQQQRRRKSSKKPRSGSNKHMSPIVE